MFSVLAQRYFFFPGHDGRETACSWMAEDRAIVSAFNNHKQTRSANENRNQQTKPTKNQKKRELNQLPFLSEISKRLTF
jgi:hypothetical protein